MAVTIGICGGSASGKTTFTHELAEKLGNSKCTILSLDSYYIDFTEKEFDASSVNYDQPASFDFDLFACHIKSLINGQSVNSPLYDFATHKRLSQIRKVSSLHYLLIEGLFLYNIPLLSGLFETKVFIDTPADIRLKRRIKRDRDERSRKLHSILNQFSQQVLPMHSKYVAPNRELAHVIIDGGKPFSGQMTLILELLKKTSGNHLRH